MSTFLAYIALIGGTLLFGPIVLLAQILGVPKRRGGIFDMAPRWWTRGILRAAGVKVVMHGAADTITMPSGSEEFVRNAKSPDKEFVSWPEDLHEIFNELDQDAVIARMIAWLDARFPARG